MPVYARQVTQPGYIIIPDVAKIRRTVREAFTVDPAFAEQREAVAAEAARVWVLNGAGVQGQAARLAEYLEYLGMTASAPNQRPDETGGRATRIVVYNGAEARLPTTVRVLEETFGVQVETATDPAARVDVAITTGSSTPTLTPPPAP